MSNRKLFVGNLAYTATETDLRDHFSQAGAVVSASIITDKETGGSRGFAFVEMATDDEAAAAIERFHGGAFAGRSLIVNVARPREEGNAGRRTRSGNRDRERRGGERW